MFDWNGGLIAELVRARVLTEVAQSRPFKRGLGLLADLLITAGAWLNTHATLPPEPEVPERRGRPS